jgi:ribonuclease VapC
LSEGVSEIYMLDASAVLALIGNEGGAERVRPLLASSAITAINLAEVVKKLRERGVPREDVEATISDLQIPLERGPSDLPQAIQVGELAAAGRAFGLSMGDAVCLAAAAWSGRTAVTAERRWADAAPGVKILTIR